MSAAIFRLEKWFVQLNIVVEGLVGRDVDNKPIDADVVISF